MPRGGHLVGRPPISCARWRPLDPGRLLWRHLVGALLKAVDGGFPILDNLPLEMACMHSPDAKKPHVPQRMCGGLPLCDRSALLWIWSAMKPAMNRREDRMRAIIDGRRYDTETATKLADWHNGYLPNDFHHTMEVLYVTSRGALFIAGSGGALSPYARACGNGRRSGEAIRPISEEEAVRWLEEKEFTHVLESRFPHLIEDA